MSNERRLIDGPTGRSVYAVTVEDLLAAMDQLNTKTPLRDENLREALQLAARMPAQRARTARDIDQNFGA